MPISKKTHNRTVTFDTRSTLVIVFLGLFFLGISYRLFRLEIVQGAQNRLLAEQQHSIYKKLLPTRGEIKISDQFSSDTYPVATTIQNFLAYAVPSEIVNPLVTSESLASVLNLDPKDVLSKISNQDKKYVPLKKQLTDDEQQKVKDLKLPGIYFDSEDTRYYPEKNLLSHVLGFVGFNKDNQKVGLYGLEKSYQDLLAGKNGFLAAEKDAGGSFIFGTNKENSPAIDGSNLVLTIDKTIQFKVEQVLKDTVIKNAADSGSVVIMNPKTGAVLAMAGYPDFNPNEYGKVQDPGVYVNESTFGNYEPGSIFKAITMAAAIDAGKMTPDSTYNDTGSISIDGYVLKNAEPQPHGIITMTQALDMSLNTGAIYAKEQVGNDTFYNYLKKFGFGVKTGIELGESRGNLDNLKTNVQVNFDTASFGQGINVTPLQMVQSYTALANGGKMMQPYIVASKIAPDGTVTNTQPHIVSQVISENAAHTVAGMLTDVVENGLGKKAAIPGYYIAGKTGTAQVARTDGRGYQANVNIGSFIGFGPVNDPAFVMLVRIDHPRDVKFAEVTAAPAWGQIAQFILNYYRIPPTRPLPVKK